MANQKQKKQVAEMEECNKNMVSDFYKALAATDAAMVHRLLAPNIEWWFHGPPACNHLMSLLTGRIRSSSHDSFAFKPLSIVSIGSMVLAEGYETKEGRKVSWVHAWTVTDGVITQVREYFNTSVTVTRFAKSASNNVQMASPMSATCQSVWQSKLTDNASMPGLLLAL